jgi:hypothetical protein
MQAIGALRMALDYVTLKIQQPNTRRKDIDRFK